MTNDSAAPGQAARDQVVKRLKKQRDFRGHLLAYLLVNTLLVTIWATTSHGFFWPGIIMAAWGIGLAMNAWDAYSRQDLSEEAIGHELGRRNRRG